MKLLLSLFFISILSFSKVIIISDIDETVKQSGSHSLMTSITRFILNKKNEYPGITKVFRSIEDENEENIFTYVSASFSFLYKADSWLKNHNLGFFDIAYQRKLKDEKLTYKIDKAQEIIDTYYNKGDSIYLFGDSSELDAEAWLEVKKNNSNKLSHIFIRDVHGEFNAIPHLPKKKREGIFYFFTDKDLINSSVLNLDHEVVSYIEKLSFKDLLPNYSRRHLIKRAIKHTCGKARNKNCEQVVRKNVIDYILKEFSN